MPFWILMDVFFFTFLLARERRDRQRPAKRPPDDRGRNHGAPRRERRS